MEIGVEIAGGSAQRGPRRRCSIGYLAHRAGRLRTELGGHLGDDVDRKPPRRADARGRSPRRRPRGREHLVAGDVTGHPGVRHAQ